MTCAQARGAEGSPQTAGARKRPAPEGARPLPWPLPGTGPPSPWEQAALGPRDASPEAQRGCGSSARHTAAGPRGGCHAWGGGPRSPHRRSPAPRADTPGPARSPTTSSRTSLQRMWLPVSCSRVTAIRLWIPCQEPGGATRSGSLGAVQDSGGGPGARAGQGRGCGAHLVQQEGPHARHATAVVHHRRDVAGRGRGCVSRAASSLPTHSPDGQRWGADSTVSPGLGQRRGPVCRDLSQVGRGRTVCHLNQPPGSPGSTPQPQGPRPIPRAPHPHTAALGTPACSQGPLSPHCSTGDPSPSLARAPRGRDSLAAGLQLTDLKVDQQVVLAVTRPRAGTSQRTELGGRNWGVTGDRQVLRAR